MPYAIDTQSFEGGFADPVFGAQAVFSKLLSATSRPGTVIDFPECCRPPEPLSLAQGALLLALCDDDTPVYIERSSQAVIDWLAFQAGARGCSPEEAHFAVVEAPGRDWLKRLPLGTLAYPDRSAAILCEVVDIEAGDRFSLTGPGIDGTAPMSVSGLPNDFVEFRKANRGLFPCGLDLFLTCGSRLLALPRSTIVTEV